MFPKATLLALITLVIHAAAVPVKRAAGISIPLHKRGSYTTSEGVFDRAKAARASVVTHNKYRQNLITLKANGGTLREGAVIKELAIYHSEFIKRQSEPLIDENQDTEWAGKVSIGTPPVEFLIDFDSTYPRCLYGSSTVLTHASQLDLPTCGSRALIAKMPPVQRRTGSTHPSPPVASNKMETSRSNMATAALSQALSSRRPLRSQAFKSRTSSSRLCLLCLPLSVMIPSME
jgi:hypothetical protein